MAAQLAGLNAVTGNTTEKQSRYWGYWLWYLKTIKLNDDPFLSGFSHRQKHHIISGFGTAVRANDVQTYPGASSASAPISSMVCTTFNAVAQAYQSHDRKSPIHDADGKLAFILQQQLRGYANCDASTKPQKALTPCILRELGRMTTTEADEAAGQLAKGAFFFAMRS